MIFNHLASVAFYCRRCGQIHIFDVPYFCGREQTTLICPNCAFPVATLAVKSRRGLVAEVDCGACGAVNVIDFPLKKLIGLRFEKIYCREDRFELGYIGRWQAIAEFLDFNAAEFDALNPGDDYNFVGQHQVLIEALNRVHDMAATRLIVCGCGGSDFTASVSERAILLKCADCGSVAKVAAENADDLRQLRAGFFPKFREKFFAPAI